MAGHRLMQKGSETIGSHRLLEREFIRNGGMVN
jgi:hypothetical protein